MVGQDDGLAFAGAFEEVCRQVVAVHLVLGGQHGVGGLVQERVAEHVLTGASERTGKQNFLVHQDLQPAIHVLVVHVVDQGLHARGQEGLAEDAGGAQDQLASLSNGIEAHLHGAQHGVGNGSGVSTQGEGSAQLLQVEWVALGMVDQPRNLVGGDFAKHAPDHVFGRALAEGAE